MVRTLSFVYSAILALLFATMAQSQASKPLLGTVSAFKPENLQIEVKTDAGDVTAISVSADTLVQRVAPGEKDLRKSEKIEVTGIAIGDRVLVTFKPGTTEALRIIVMPATDIAKRNEASRQDWLRHGVAGIVTARKGNEITLRSRSMMGENISTVTVSESTQYRRYAPDSVRFADAKTSSIGEVKVGDQLRARGEKSEDGHHVTAAEIVFGTFMVKAGTITEVDAANNTVTVKDIETEKPLTIRVAADTQLKRMPDFGGMSGGGMGRGMGSGTGGPPPGAGAGPGGGPGGAGRPGGMPDLTQMLERMPQAKIDAFKPGETVIVSSTKGASSNQVTAIMLLGNAGRIVQMATAQQSSRGQGGLSMSGPGLGGLELPTMMP